MKILHVINNLGAGGAEKLLVDIMPLLNKKEVEADLLLLNGDKTIFYNLLIDKGYKNIQSLNIKNIYSPFYILRLRKLIKKYDLVHTHLFPTQYWVVFAKILLFKPIKLVTTEHNTSNRRRSHIILKNIDKIVYKKYNKIITVSQEAEENLKKYLNSKDSKIITISNGIDVQTFFNAKKINLNTLINNNEAKKFIIKVASFTKQKDHPTLLKALALNNSDVHLLLAGEGVLKESIKNLAKELNIDKRVHFLGLRSDIPSLLKSADVIVMSSYYEGLSLSSLEALASGTPLIGSDVPGLGKIVRDAGILFERGNEKELASLIKKLLNNESYYKSVSESGILKSKKYDVTIMTNKYMEVYKSIIT